MGIQWIKLDDLYDHPDNPRLAPRQDVVDQIAAQLNGRMDEAHALIVRPMPAGYQIIAGHTRKLAALQAKLTEIPCWVREMTDEEGFDPFREVADALMFAKTACGMSAIAMDERVTLTTVSIAFEGNTFTGERICPQENKIDWLKGWANTSVLPGALALWNIPLCPDIFQWSLRSDALFFRAADGAFPKSHEAKRQIPHQLPDTSSDRAFEEYVRKDCVYFVRARTLNLIKIGFSANPPKRLAALKTACPDDLELLNIIPGGQNLEQSIHRRFSAQRVRGEWFTPTVEMMALIEEGQTYE
jgi:hypothetical protein